jgi:hypothetical protein
MTLEEVKSQTPSLLLPYAEAIYQRMIIAEQGLGGMDLPEGEGNQVPPKTGDGEKGIHPLDDQSGK